MGFFLRKALTVGPIRFNLSKSGVGVSGGIKGARVGVKPDGSAYTHVGREGVYHKQSIGKTSYDGTWFGKKKEQPYVPEYTTYDVNLFDNKINIMILNDVELKRTNDMIQNLLEDNTEEESIKYIIVKYCAWNSDAFYDEEEANRKLVVDRENELGAENIQDEINFIFETIDILFNTFCEINPGINI